MLSSDGKQWRDEEEGMQELSGLRIVDCRMLNLHVEVYDTSGRLGR